VGEAPAHAYHDPTTAFNLAHLKMALMSGKVIDTGFGHAKAPRRRTQRARGGAQAWAGWASVVHWGISRGGSGNF